MRCKVKNSNCVICLEDFCEDEEIAVCPCEHAFHKRCLSPWLQNNCTCPMCNMCIKPETSGSFSNRICKEQKKALIAGLVKLLEEVYHVSLN
ncbi:unnamed protein product [Adineta ricciae]|uniref:RING-type domain-containing protein n=1 Tax=Adineta ricciae TaxID=249248 RepID=A0A814RUS1_ADIRI|nr:unnamed protein product [Adineta ricciae]